MEYLIYQSPLTTKYKMRNQSELTKIWKCFSDIPGWLRLLWLAGQYTEEELDELGRIDDEFFSISRAEEIGWRKRLREELPKTPQSWLEIFPETLTRSRSLLCKKLLSIVVKNTENTVRKHS